MNPRTVWEAALNAAVLVLFALLLLYLLGPGTVEVPMPDQPGTNDDRDVVFPFA